MMISFLGSVRQTLQALFLIRYLVVQPLWAVFKTAVVYPALHAILSLLEAFGNREIPFD